MTAFKIQPSQAMRTLVDAMGGPFAASKAWGIEYRSLCRFLAGRPLMGDTIATILENSGLGYSKLFTHRRAANGK